MHMREKKREGVAGAASQGWGGDRVPGVPVALDKLGCRFLVPWRVWR